MDDYKECENYPLLSSLDQKYYEIEENQNLQTNQNHIKFDEDYDSESLLSLCTLFISENNEENMLKQYETFSKITNIIKQSTGKVDIECLQNADFGNAFCSLLHFLFEEGTNFIPFIQLLNDICLNNSDFIECLSSTDLSSMLFEIFCNSDDQIQNIIMNFLSNACILSINYCKQIYENWEIQLIIDYFNRTDNTCSLSILTTILSHIPQSSDGFDSFCESLTLLKEPSFNNTRYYTSILINILSKAPTMFPQFIHFVETTIKHSDCNNKGEITLVICRSAFKTQDNEIISNIIQQIPFQDIFVDYVNSDEELSICYYHWLFYIIFLFLLEKTAPHEYASRFSSNIDPCEINEEKELTILHVNEFLHFFFDDDVISKLIATFREGVFNLRYSALSLMHVLLYTNNVEFYRLIINKGFPFSVSSFLDEVDTDSDPHSNKEILIQTKVLQIYVLLLRKTPLDLQNELFSQITSSDAIPVLENIGTDDSDYILRLLRSYSLMN